MLGAYIFRPNLNILAKALHAFAQLLPPCSHDRGVHFQAIIMLPNRVTRIQQYVPWILILAKRELRSQKARVRKRNKRIHCSLCRHFSVKISPEKRNPLLWKNVSVVKKIEWAIMVSFQCMKKEILVLGSLCLGCGGLWLSRWKVITDNGAISLQANLTPPNQCQPKARP